MKDSHDWKSVASLTQALIHTMFSIFDLFSNDFQDQSAVIDAKLNKEKSIMNSPVYESSVPDSALTIRKSEQWTIHSWFETVFVGNVPYKLRSVPSAISEWLPFTFIIEQCAKTIEENLLNWNEPNHIDNTCCNSIFDYNIFRESTRFSLVAFAYFVLHFPLPFNIMWMWNTIMSFLKMVFWKTGACTQWLLNRKFKAVQQAMKLSVHAELTVWKKKSVYSVRILYFVDQMKSSWFFYMYKNTNSIRI